jgi:hypothetical protein
LKRGGRDRILSFWRIAKALKESIYVSTSNLDEFADNDSTVVSNDDVSTLSINMLQIWHEYFNCKDPITELVYINEDIVSGFESVVLKFGEIENERIALIDNKGVQYLYMSMDEVLMLLMHRFFNLCWKMIILYFSKIKKGLEKLYLINRTLIFYQYQL